MPGKMHADEVETDPSLVRLLVVFHFLRQALGTQTAPSNPTLLGLALMMTWFLMTPVLTQLDQQAVERRLMQLVERFNARNGYRFAVQGSFTAPPKLLDGATLRLLEQVAQCGRELGLDLRWRDSGGTCDGNRLAAAGLPNVDSLGPRGGGLHSPEEFLVLDSLTERAKLTAVLLMRLAAGGLEWPAPQSGV